MSCTLFNNNDKPVNNWHIWKGGKGENQICNLLKNMKKVKIISENHIYFMTMCPLSISIVNLC